MIPEKILREARRDYRKFVSLCFRTEEGEPVKVADFQRAWVGAALTHRRTLIWCPVEHGKSKHMSVWFPIWVLAHEPNYRIMIVSNTASQAIKFSEEIRENIEKNEILHELFPNLLPGSEWTKGSFKIKRSAIMKDPSVQAVGAYGPVIGARADIIILDDIIDFENSATVYLQDKLMRWLDSSVFTRRTKNGRIVAVGTKWTKFDVYHRLVKRKGWAVFEYSAFKDKKQTQPLWPEQWPLKRLRDKLGEIGPREFARQFQNDIEATTSSRFDRRWFNFAERKGFGLSSQYRYTANKNEIVVIGVDLATKKKLGADQTVFMVLAVSEKYKQLLWLETGRLSGPEIVQKLHELHTRYPDAIFAVESNAQQEYILQFFKDSPDAKDIAVIPFYTSKKKRDPFVGVERIARDMAAGVWIVPANPTPEQKVEIEDFYNDLLSYDPARHLPDRMAATYIASTVGDMLIANGAVKQKQAAIKRAQGVQEGEEGGKAGDITTGGAKPQQISIDDVFVGLVTDNYVGVLRPVVSPETGSVVGHELLPPDDPDHYVFIEGKRPFAIVSWNTVPKNTYIHWVMQQKPLGDKRYVYMKTRQDKFIRKYGNLARNMVDGKTLTILHSVWLGELARLMGNNTKRWEMYTRDPIVRLLATAGFVIETFTTGWYADLDSAIELIEAERQGQEASYEEEPEPEVKVETETIQLPNGEIVSRVKMTPELFQRMLNGGGWGLGPGVVPATLMGMGNRQPYGVPAQLSTVPQIVNFMRQLKETEKKT